LENSSSPFLYATIDKYGSSRQYCTSTRRSLGVPYLLSVIVEGVGVIGVRRIIRVPIYCVSFGKGVILPSVAAVVQNGLEHDNFDIRSYAPRN